MTFISVKDRSVSGIKIDVNASVVVGNGCFGIRFADGTEVMEKTLDCSRKANNLKANIVSGGYAKYDTDSKTFIN